MSREARPLVFEAGTLFTPTESISRARLVVRGSSVVAAGPADRVPIPTDAELVDATDLIVTPGFIDPHVHGSGGADAMDASFESLNTISRVLARHGTTAFLATTVSSPPELLAGAVEKLGTLVGDEFEGAHPVGIHLEGPFINSKKRGTHKAANILKPDAALLQKWIEQSRRTIRLITIAPEVDGVGALIDAAIASGIPVSMGHSNASFDQAMAAIDRGVCYAVHTFNAMREFSHRDPGIAGAVLADDRVMAEIIADGVHVSPPAVRLFARAKGPDLILLGTDATSATGMPDGRYALGPGTVKVEDGICRDEEGRLAGSRLNQDRALSNFMNWTGWSLSPVLRGLTLNPARALKLQNKGRLEPGFDADITILDGRCRVIKTYVGGKLVFDRLHK